MCLNLIRSILIHELTLLIHGSSKVLSVDLGRDGEDVWVVFKIPVEPNLTVRATAHDRCDTSSTPGKSPAVGTRLPSTRTGEGTRE